MPITKINIKTIKREKCTYSELEDVVGGLYWIEWFYCNQKKQHN